jgi:hypothetical protein
MHFAVIPMVDPVGELRLRPGEVDIGDSNGLKSEFPPPRPDRDDKA